MNGMRASHIVPVALVHHANQYLITEGYDNRQGILEVVEGYAAALRLHERYGVCANLHLSGALIEAIAWHCPWFLTLVRTLCAKGLVALIGGTYAENVMLMFPPAFNLRQLNEHLWLCHHHLCCPPSEVKVCWVPERVWDTARLAPVITSRQLANGGIRYVLLDDRLLYPINGSYSGSPRALFDSTGPFDFAPHSLRSGTSQGKPFGSMAASPDGHRPFTSLRAGSSTTLRRLEGGFGQAETYTVYRIAGANGLGIVPISANLRYWIPPRLPDHWRCLEETIEALAQDGGDDKLLVYADDLEKTAGVGGWEPGALERYEAFLRWIISREDVAPVLLSDWLDGRPPKGERVLEAGAFFELAQNWQAGEDYRGWWESAAWSPYRRYLASAQNAVRAAEREGADSRLLTLAWKHLLASAYETAWHDPAEGARAPAPWARAVTSHARASLVIAAAARWAAGARRGRSPSARIIDIDDDGEDEVVMRSERLYAVITPSHGGRLAYLFNLTSQGGALVIGNPTDDWNFQQELNRYMDWPPNHPGALVDVGSEHDRYQVSAVGETAPGVEMTNVQHGSRLFGTHKSVIMAPDAPALVVCYHLPGGCGGLAVEACLSPDYYRLLREGRRGLSPSQGRTWFGFRNEDVGVWIGLACDEETFQADPAHAAAAHRFNIPIQAKPCHFHLVVGCGQIDDEQCQQLIEWGRNAVHRPSPPAPLPSKTTGEGSGAASSKTPADSVRPPHTAGEGRWQATGEGNGGA